MYSKCKYILSIHHTTILEITGNDLDMTLLRMMIKDNLFFFFFLFRADFLENVKVLASFSRYFPLLGCHNLVSK